MSAIEVRSQTHVSPGNAASVAGVLSLGGCQRVLVADVVHTDGPSPPMRRSACGSAILEAPRSTSPPLAFQAPLDPTIWESWRGAGGV